MQYPTVERAHVVPRSYLKQWAKDDRIGARLLGSSVSKTIGLDDAAIRKRFYRRRRPDGAEIDDVEWMLSTNEKRTAPVLRELRERWPLQIEDKGTLATCFALLLVRGPHWRDWHEAFTKDFIAEQEAVPASPSALSIGVSKVTDEEILVELQQHLMSETQRLIRMLSLARTLAGVLGSMHWTLIEFRSAVAATSDHPVVVWPGTDQAYRPQ
jgi:hypothetical protein